MLESNAERLITCRAQTVQFLLTVLMLLQGGCHLHDSTLSSRLARATMPLLTIVLSKRSETNGESESSGAQGRSKKSRKRARGYEGDEVFKVGREIVCATAEEGDILLTAVDGKSLCNGSPLSLTDHYQFLLSSGNASAENTSQPTRPLDRFPTSALDLCCFTTAATCHTVPGLVPAS